jgi:hypothetical protein
LSEWRRESLVQRKDAYSRSDCFGGTLRAIVVLFSDRHGFDVRVVVLCFLDQYLSSIKYVPSLTIPI